MTCDVEEPALVWPPKHPDDDEDYYVDFERECARYWQPNSDFVVGTRVRPPRSIGYEIEAATGGRTGSRQPVWPSVVGQTVIDGSVVWTLRALTTASLRRTIVGVPTWTPDAGVSASSVAISGMMGSAKLAGGIDGQDYPVLIHVAFSDGANKTVTCILPVRRPVRVCAG